MVLCSWKPTVVCTSTISSIPAAMEDTFTKIRWLGCTYFFFVEISENKLCIVLYCIVLYFCLQWEVTTEKYEFCKLGKEFGCAIEAACSTPINSYTVVQNYYFSVEVMISIAWDTDTNNKVGAKAKVAFYVEQRPKHTKSGRVLSCTEREFYSCGCESRAVPCSFPLVRTFDETDGADDNFDACQRMNVVPTILEKACRGAFKHAERRYGMARTIKNSCRVH